MSVRFRFNCACILLLSILLRSRSSHCGADLADAATRYRKNPLPCAFLFLVRGSLLRPLTLLVLSPIVRADTDDPDPSIEQIFGSPRASDPQVSPTSDRRGKACKPDAAEERGRSKREGRKREEAKRDGARRRSVKRESVPSERSGRRSAVARIEEKRSNAPRPGRSSGNLPEDYALSLDGAEYRDDLEDGSSGSSKVKLSEYKAGDPSLSEDTEGFIDQDERSSLYDDFEAKDVVKRGISGAEDYEELGEEPSDIAALGEEAPEEDAERGKAREGGRAKRDQESPKSKVDIDPGISADSPAESKPVRATPSREPSKDKENVVPEGNKDKLTGEPESKRNAGEGTPDSSRGNPAGEAQSQPLLIPELVEGNAGSRESLRPGEVKVQELPGNERNSDSPGEALGLEEVSRFDPVVPDPSNPSGASASASSSGNASPEEPARLENAGSDGGAPGTGGQSGGYEKRVEERIQRKIDSIKEEIKREIAENQRFREIEENNARFDVLREEEEAEAEEAVEIDPSGNNLVLRLSRDAN